MEVRFFSLIADTRTLTRPLLLGYQELIVKRMRKSPLPRHYGVDHKHTRERTLSEAPESQSASSRRRSFATVFQCNNLVGVNHFI